MRIKVNINKKYLIIGIITTFFIGISILMYGEFKESVLKKEYINDIYVEAEETATEEVVAEKRVIVVEIKGQVKKPDVYELEEGSIVKDLIDKAGGITKEASLDNINRAKRLQDNELVVIMNKNEIDNNLQEGNGESSKGKININMAGVEQLQELDGVGESKANSIIEYREKNGRFQGIEDIMNVTGIGEKTFEKFKDKIEV